jgi:alpha-glucosidase (family GH31 glycosyl hydrolase)
VGSTEEDSGWKRDEHADTYVLLPLGDAEALRADFVLLTGRTPLSSIKTLGSWWSKWSKYSDEDRYKIFARYRENDLPLDIMVVDTEWKNTYQNGNDGDGTGYAVNTDLFPNMEQFLGNTKDDGILILFNDHTHKTDLPITDPAELKWQSAGIRSLLELGLDGWWYDRNWSFSVKCPYKDVRFSTIGQVLYYDTMRAFHRDSASGTAKRALALCKEAGVTMTGAGATFPYGKDPADSNIRVAPSLPPVSELEQAVSVFCTCLKLAALEKLMA